MQSMKAAYITRYGRTEVLNVGKQPVPAPKEDQVLIKVKAASINPRDWLLMRGIYPFKKLAEPFPIILGSDMSGTIISVGKNVTELMVGDDVFGMQPIKGKFGAFAEFAAIQSSAVALKPKEIDHSSAAAMPCAGMTSLQTLRDLVSLKKGETILINGASGGVGSYAVQIARAYGAYVVAVCSAENANLCRSLGADKTIDYRSENFEQHQNQYDVVYDVIGRSSPAKARCALKKGGRYVSTVPSPMIMIQSIFSKITSKFGLFKGQTAHLILVKPKGADLAVMASMMQAGSLQSIIDSTFALEDAPQAFEKSQSWRSKGKIILKISD